MTVKESIETLQGLRAEHSGTPLDQRLQLLAALKETPDARPIDLARRLDIPKQTVSYWLRLYRDGGLEALLKVKARRSSRAANDREAIPGPSHLWDDARWLAFVNALPLAMDTVEWAVKLRQALAEYLGDVDNVVISVVTNLDLVQPDTNKQGQYHLQDHNTATARTKVRVTRALNLSGWKAFFDIISGDGFPAHLYQAPAGFDYWYKTKESYLGSIILFRKKGQPPISKATEKRMEELRPFLVYILSNHVACQRLKNPADLIFRDLVPRIAANADLTTREQEVLMLLFTGYANTEISTHLHISLRTVESHISHIYTKTGVSRVSELWGLYMTPQLVSKSR